MLILKFHEIQTPIVDNEWERLWHSPSFSTSEFDKECLLGWFLKLEEIQQETQEEINKTEALNLAKQKLASELTDQLLALNKHGN